MREIMVIVPSILLLLDMLEMRRHKYGLVLSKTYGEGDVGVLCKKSIRLPRSWCSSNPVMPLGDDKQMELVKLWQSELHGVISFIQPASGGGGRSRVSMRN